MGDIFSLETAVSIVVLSEIDEETSAFGANFAIRAAAVLPALFSSMKLRVELIMSRINMPAKP